MIITGLSVKKNSGKGKLLFFDRNTLSKLSELEISDSVSSELSKYLKNIVNVQITMH